MKKLIFSLTLCAFIYSCNISKKGSDKVKPVAKLTYEEELLKMVNEIRKTGYTCGSKVMPPVGALVLNEALNKAAKLHSVDMYTKKYFSHFSKDDNKDFKYRASLQGYKSNTMGENIYYNSFSFESPDFPFLGWKESEGHCKNMMSEKFKEMGVGNEEGYWTQLFGTR
ncbi:MAG: CAP domain-containing protein [Leadbetterella sp.]